MLKLLHTADIHLGARFVGLGTNGSAQREQVRETFRRIISLAVSERFDMVLIAGDLFDSNEQSPRNIELVVEGFRRLGENHIPVCLIPGNHDCLSQDSIYHKVDLEAECPNLTIFRSPGWSLKEFSSLSLTLYGRPCLSKESSESPLRDLKPQTQTQFHVALAHGSLFIPGKVSPNDHVFTPQEVEGCGMSYLALGHWHRYYRLEASVPACYPGTPELTTVDQEEPGSVLQVEIAPEGVNIIPRQVGRRRADRLEIDMAEVGSLEEVRQKILQGANRDLIRRVVLKGLRHPDLSVDSDELSSELAPSFFHLTIEDQSFSTSEISAVEDNPLSVRSRFLRLMEARINASADEEKRVAQEALQLGLAILEGKEVL